MGDEGYFYDWNERKTNDPRFPGGPPGTPATMVFLDGEAFTYPIGRCLTGKNGYIVYRPSVHPDPPPLNPDGTIRKERVTGKVELFVFCDGVEVS